MKILIYARTFTPDVGGVETYAMLLAQGLAARPAAEKVSVTVVTNSPAKNFEDSSLPFAVVRRPGIVQLKKLIRASDVVNLAGPALAPLFFCVTMHTPVVVGHHGYQAICPNGLLLREPDKSVCPGHFMRHEFGACLKCNASALGWAASLKMLALTWPRRWFCRRANTNLCVSDHVARRLQLPNSIVVYSGIPIRKSSTAPAGITEFSYVGRFVSEKGLPLLLQAAEILDKNGILFKLSMIGDGPDRSALEQQVDRLGLRHKVHFTGFLRGSDLERALETVSVVVMPSIWEETAGLSAIEHMMRGRPVVVSDIGGLAEVTGDGGLKFPPGDAAALAHCLRRLVEDHALLATLGAHARARAQSLFNQARMVEDHFAIFHRVTQSSGS